MNEYFSFDFVKSVSPEIRGIIHIGGHYGEEADVYEAYGVPALWFEAHPEYAEKMREHLSHFHSQFGFEVCFSDVDDAEVDFYITADEFASSMLKPKEHQIENPHAYLSDTIKVKTKRFDTWAGDKHFEFDKFNMLVLDVQGAELQVLHGMGDRLSGFDVIATEYSTVEFYENVPQLADLETFLVDFTRVFPEVGNEFKHADALFVRK